MKKDRLLDIITSIIEEHREIEQSFHNTEQIIDDFGAIREVKKATAFYEPAHFDPDKRSIERFRELIKTVGESLHAHFNREETSLLEAFIEQGDTVLSSALYALMKEHENIKNRLIKLEHDIDDLANEKPSVQVWHAKAYGIRTYFNHTRTLIEAHAKSEQELFQLVQEKLLQ